MSESSDNRAPGAAGGPETDGMALFQAVAQAIWDAGPGASKDHEQAWDAAADVLWAGIVEHTHSEWVCVESAMVELRNVFERIWSRLSFQLAPGVREFGGGRRRFDGPILFRIIASALSAYGAGFSDETSRAWESAAKLFREGLARGLPYRIAVHYTLVPLTPVFDAILRDAGVYHDLRENASLEAAVQRAAQNGLAAPWWREDDLGAQARAAGKVRAVRCRVCGTRWELEQGPETPAQCGECGNGGRMPTPKKMPPLEFYRAGEAGSAELSRAAEALGLGDAVRESPLYRAFVDALAPDDPAWERAAKATIAAMAGDHEAGGVAMDEMYDQIRFAFSDAVAQLAPPAPAPAPPLLSAEEVEVLDRYAGLGADKARDDPRGKGDDDPATLRKLDVALAKLRGVNVLADDLVPLDDNPDQTLVGWRFTLPSSAMDAIVQPMGLSVSGRWFAARVRGLSQLAAFARDGFDLAPGVPLDTLKNIASMLRLRIEERAGDLFLRLRVGGVVVELRARNAYEEG